MFRAAAVDELVKASNVQRVRPARRAAHARAARPAWRGASRRAGIDAGTYLQLTGQTAEQLNSGCTRRRRSRSRAS